MRFQHPEYLPFLLAVPFLLFVLWSWQRWRRDAVAAFGNEEAMGRLLPPFSKRPFWARNLLFASSVGLLIVALANPLQTGSTGQQHVESSDIMLALDISNSMLAEDIKPNRLELARRFATDLIKKLEGERIGLILFAGSAFLQVPLSTDYGFLAQSLQSASPDLLTTQGTAISEAVKLSETTFDSENATGRALILITDGEDHDQEAVETIENAFSQQGIITFAVGAGTVEGGPIPTNLGGNGAYKRDENGQIIRTKLNEKLLRDMALAGHTGQALSLRQEAQALRVIEQQVAELSKQDLVLPVSALLQTRYQWALGAALLGLLLFYAWGGRRHPGIS